VYTLHLTLDTIDYVTVCVHLHSTLWRPILIAGFVHDSEMSKYFVYIVCICMSL
jgi:hypothetical protein